MTKEITVTLSEESWLHLLRSMEDYASMCGQFHGPYELDWEYLGSLEQQVKK